VNAARLRFIVVLLAIGAVIAYWDTLRAYYEKITRPASAAVAAASDLEFSCPMHPSIVRDHPDKCPICGMPLSKRKKDEDDEPLPAGVIDRRQLSPYRVALAGIQTSEIGYLPLKRETRAVGFVEFDERRLARIPVRVTGKSRIDKLYVNVTGQEVRAGDPLAELYSPDLVVTVQNLLDARAANNVALERVARDRLSLWGIAEDQIKALLKTDKPITHVTIRSSIGGHVIKKYQVEGEYVEEGARLFDVADLSTVWVEAQLYEDELVFLKEGLEVAATVKAFPGRTFPGHIAFIHPHLDAPTRTLRVRFNVENPGHDLRPGMYASVKLIRPAAATGTVKAALDEDWQTELAADSLPRIWSGSALPFISSGADPLMKVGIARGLAASGLVLAVPESAVIDTGSRKLVYRQAAAGVFDAIEVRLAPLCEGFYPVLRGLQAGDRVATAGAFLLDAETRLTTGGGGYVTASAAPSADKRPNGVRPSMNLDPQETKIQLNLGKLNPIDRKLAEGQRVCVVQQKNRLGSMGVPIKIMVRNQPVFLCCGGCEDEAKENPDATLATVEKLKAGPAGHHK
jgi:Cu(I)/Ag(I) efflux system membrane fusion protein